MIVSLSNSFSGDLEEILAKIDSKEPFAFARYADGEYNVIHQIQARGCDGWEVGPEDKLMAQVMLEGLQHKEENYYYGISCRCCDHERMSYYRNILGWDCDRITFSNLFVNGNHPRFIEWCKGLKQPVFMMGNRTGAYNDYPFQVSDYMPISADVIKAFREYPDIIKNGASNTAREKSGRLFFIAAGPLSEILIHYMYSANPNNTYIDIGSALDMYIHGKATRAYHGASPFSTRECTF